MWDGIVVCQLISLKNNYISVTCGGEGGIRTLDTLASMPHFECGAFNHSATSPSLFYGFNARDGWLPWFFGTQLALNTFVLPATH